MVVELVVGVAALLCGLVTGLLLGFAVVAMPGIRVLDDAGFVRAFQAMDRVIQDRQPLFMLLWVGSVVAVVGALLVGLGDLDGLPRVALVAAALLWLVGVQVPTATINIPLNVAIQAVDVATASPAEVTAARAAFEDRWNRWNAIRSALGAAATACLLVALAG